jgi:hypothetical protein
MRGMPDVIAAISFPFILSNFFCVWRAGRIPLFPFESRDVMSLLIITNCTPCFLLLLGILRAFLPYNRKAAYFPVPL